MSAVKLFFRMSNIFSDPFTNWISKKNVTIEKDIVYDESNPAILKTDLYYSKKENYKYPVFVNVHGGGFVDGDKKYRRGFSLVMARQGFFVMNINYGLCPEFKFPYFINNAINALNWIDKNCDKYNLDLDNVFISGDSSGAFISALTASALTNPKIAKEINAPKCNIKLKGTVLYCGVYDMKSLCLPSDILKKNINYARIVNGLTSNELEKMGIYDTFRPDNYVTKDFPPTFITYSKKDLFVSDLSKILIDAFEKYNVPHETFIAHRRRDIHCFHLRPIIKTARKCMKASKSYLKDRIEFKPLLESSKAKIEHKIEETIKKNIEEDNFEEIN